MARARSGLPKAQTDTPYLEHGSFKQAPRAFHIKSAPHTPSLPAAPLNYCSSGRMLKQLHRSWRLGGLDLQVSRFGHGLLSEAVS